MNKKHKSKNKPNKPPNPVPPQKQQQHTEERVESEQKVQERVPEITPEVIAAPDLVDIKKDAEIDTPRKPKRNRTGKNKSQEKELGVKNEEIKEKCDIVRTDVSIENVAPVVEEAQEQQTEVAVPTSRKKKNKNKKNAENTFVETTQKEEITPASIEVKNDETTLQLESLISSGTSDQNIKPIIVEQEPVASKKKNKNKKNKKCASESDKVDVTDSSKVPDDENNTSAQEFVDVRPVTLLQSDNANRQCPGKTDEKVFSDIVPMTDNASLTTSKCKGEINKNKGKNKNKNKESDQEKPDNVKKIKPCDIISKAEEQPLTQIEKDITVIGQVENVKEIAEQQIICDKFPVIDNSKCKGDVSKNKRKNKNKDIEHVTSGNVEIMQPPDIITEGEKLPLPKNETVIEGVSHVESEKSVIAEKQTICDIVPVIDIASSTTTKCKDEIPKNKGKNKNKEFYQEKSDKVEKIKPSDIIFKAEAQPLTKIEKDITAISHVESIKGIAEQQIICDAVPVIDSSKCKDEGVSHVESEKIIFAEKQVICDIVPVIDSSTTTKCKDEMNRNKRKSKNKDKDIEHSSSVNVEKIEPNVLLSKTEDKEKNKEDIVVSNVETEKAIGEKEILCDIVPVVDNASLTRSKSKEDLNKIKIKNKDIIHGTPDHIEKINTFEKTTKADEHFPKTGTDIFVSHDFSDVDTSSSQTTEVKVTKQSDQIPVGVAKCEISSGDVLLKADELEDFPTDDDLKFKKKGKKEKKRPITFEEMIELPKSAKFNEAGFNAQKDEEHNDFKKSDVIVKDKTKSDIIASEVKLPFITPESGFIYECPSTSDKCKKVDRSYIDITPDSIEYPRSVSEQTFTDTNNNTVISEISVEEAHTLGVPLHIPDTPLIVGSGESPIETGNTITKIKVTCTDNQKPLASPTIKEKTDLKSKVIEVNQDMEELRMSIEKSLAELTAIDKNEKMPELISIGSVQQNVSTKTGKPNKSTASDSLVASAAQVTAAIQETKEINVLLGSEQEIESQPDNTNRPRESVVTTDTVLCPPRKDKGKGKSKKKSKNEADNQTKHETPSSTSNITSIVSTDVQETKTDESKTDKKEEQSKESQAPQQSDNTKKQSDNTKKQSDASEDNSNEDNKEFEPIESFEDAMTSSADDVNKSFELISNEMSSSQNNPPLGVPVENTERITASEADNDDEDTEEKLQVENPLVSHPKNLLGHPDIPVPSSKTDYKKEKDKIPNEKQAQVKVEDTSEIEQTERARKLSKHSQTDNKPKIVVTKPLKPHESYENEEYVYKYSFRKVFLPSSCHVCKKELKEDRVTCNSCNLLFYCSQKHKDEDWKNHQSFCLAVSTLIHLKGLKHIYADAKEVTGQNYRLLRMQMIVACEKILKRRLAPSEQEALLYPRVCTEPACREWRQACLKDCDGCQQVAYCREKPNHFPKSHLRWCKSYRLYGKLVAYQQIRGRLEPGLPTKVIADLEFELPDKINQLLATLYEEKIDMDELQYAALTQLATAPLTAAYCHQLYTNNMNSTYANGIYKKSSFTLHIVGAELQFEADALNKWEIFFLHLKPHVKELRIALVGPELNPSNLPLELLARIKLCENCRQNNRKIVFSFHDKQLYHQFSASDDYCVPDIVCAFNPCVHRSVGSNGKDSWPPTVHSILKSRTPFCVTSYTPDELAKDLARIEECSSVEFKVISAPSQNPYASVRPDRNFISDDEMPLLFKNYCCVTLCGKI